MSYTLADPIPDILTLSSVGGENLVDAVSIGGCRFMWKNPSTNVTHLLACFGGFSDAPWYGHYVNLSTATNAIVAGLTGTAGFAVYDPVTDKFYVASSYANTLVEFIPSTVTLNEIDDSSPGTCNDLILGDDQRIYRMASGTDYKRVYSYDPNVGLPSGLVTFPPLTMASNDNKGNIDADSTHVYVAFKKGDDSYSLASSPVTGTLTWTEWQYAGNGDKNLAIYRNASGALYAWRYLSDWTPKYYPLANGVPGTETSEPTRNTKIEAPRNCIALASEEDYHQFNTWYGYDVDFQYLFPIKDVFEKSQVGYKLHADPDFTYTDEESFTGPWVNQGIRQLMPKTGNEVLCLGQAYTAAVSIDYDIPTRSYLGMEIIDPYVLKKQPISGEYYAGGYSNSVWRYAPNSGWTLTNSNSAAIDTGGAPGQDGRPNPYKIYLPSPVIHYRYLIDFDSQGFVWIGGNTTRLSSDYGNLTWYDPDTGDTGSSLPDWANAPVKLMRSMCSCLGGTKILVSDMNDILHRVDTTTQAEDATPYSVGEAGHSVLLEVANDRVMVLETSGKVGLFQPSTMTWATPLQVWGDGISGYAFGPADNVYTRMYRKLEMGPDDFVWMFISNALYRIDPVTLEFHHVVDTDYGSIDFANNQRDLVLYNINAGSDSAETYINYIQGIFTYTADYSRGSYISLPVDDANLDTSYTGDDITDIAADDTDMVAQLAISQKAIHQFKQQINGIGGIISVVAQVTIPCSTSTTYLQIYNRSGTPAWDSIDSDNATGANTDFTLSATVADLTNYKDENDIVACRVYQEMQ